MAKISTANPDLTVDEIIADAIERAPIEYDHLQYSDSKSKEEIVKE